MLNDVTRAGVESATREFDALGRDAFLAKYGFGPARSYFLVRDGRRYDSKAICGAAHGFDRPDEGPLGPGDFSGGSATVAALLRRLGFEVTQAAPNRTGWTLEERTLALDLYFRVGTASRTHPDVVALSAELNRRRFHPDAGSRENFRNPAAIALKLANFAALDPSHIGTGMTSYSAGDEETWDTFSGDADLLAESVAAIHSARLPLDAITSVSGAFGPVIRPVEERIRDSYEVAPRMDTVYAERRESELVERFVAWLRGKGSTVTAHHYPIVQPPLRNDLADETNLQLWEAKASVSRSSIRMALGQLLDYLRFEPPAWRGGVLLPHPPSDDLVALIRTSGHAVAWPNGPTTFKRLGTAEHPADGEQQGGSAYSV